MTTRDESRQRARRNWRWLAGPLAAAVMLCVSARPASAQVTNLGTVSLGDYYLQLSAANTWAVQAGSTLPPGLSLRFRPDVPDFFSNANGAGVFGTLTTPGTFPFTLLRDGVPINYQLKVTALSISEYWNFPDAYIGGAYSYQLSGINNAGTKTWSANVSTLPPGLTVNASGVLGGTPTAAGVYHPLITLSDGTDTISRQFNLTITTVHFTSPLYLPNAIQNHPYVATITAAGGAGGYTFTADGFPTGLTLDPSGVISGTPTSAPSHNWFQVTATDINHQAVVRSMSIFVQTEPASLPSINPGGKGFLDSCTIGFPCSTPVYVNNGGRAPFTWAVAGLPPGMEARTSPDRTQWWAGPGNLELRGAPTQMGTFPITFTVTDADGLTATNTFNLQVTDFFLWRYFDAGTVNIPYSQKLILVGGHPPFTGAIGDTILPKGLTFDGSTNTLSGTPVEVGNDFGGEFTFTDFSGSTFHVNDYFTIGGGTSTILITSGKDLGTRTAGNTFTSQFGACCVPSTLWSPVGGPLPPWLTLSSSGLLTGNPPVGTSGTYLFTVQAADASNLSNVAVREFKVYITPMTTAGTQPLAGNVGVQYTASFTASGGTGTVTWSLEPFDYLPPGLALHSGTGIIDGTPTESGRYSFTLRATDSLGVYVLRGVTINIYPAGQTPPLNLPIGFTQNSVIGAFNLQLAANGGTGPYSYQLTPGWSDVPGLRVQSGQPLPTNFASTSGGGYLGVLTTPGTYQTSIRVTDSLGAMFDRVFNVIVSPLRILSNTTFPKATINVPYTFTLEPYGALAYGWSATGLPAGIAIDGLTGEISGTPTVAGVFSPTITLTDLADGTSRNTGFSVTVDPFAITTTGVPPLGTVGTFYNLPLNAPGCGLNCTWTLAAGSAALPAGLSLSAGGVVSGTPTAVTTAGVNIQASGSNGTVQKLFGMRVASNTPQPLTITTTSLADLTAGNLSTTTVNVTGGMEPFTWSLAMGSSLPPGVGLGQPSEILGGNLTPGFARLLGRPMQVGVYAFTIQVTDGAGTVATRQYTWNVSALNSSYNTLPLAGTTLTYATPYTQPLLFTGGIGAYSSWSATGLPPGLALNTPSVDNPVGIVVSGTPTDTGTFTATVTVQNEGHTLSNGRTLTQSITFTVAGPTGTVLGLPAANLGTVALGGARTNNIIPTGGTPPYTIANTTPLPPGFVLSPISGAGIAAGSVAFTGFGLVPGQYSFTIRAQDSVGNLAVRTYSLTVASFIALSTTVPDGSVGVAYSAQLASFGAAVTWSTTGGVPPGLSISPTGLLSGTPTTAGNYSFQIVETDGTSIITSTVTMRVSNLAITGSSILPTAILGEDYNHQLTATGGTGVVWTMTGLPAGLTLSADGLISGEAQTTGNFNVVATASNGGIAVSRRFLLPVRTHNPSLLNITLANTYLADAVVGEAVSLTLTVNQGAPPIALQLAGGALPPGLSLISGAALPSTSTPGSTLLSGVPTAAGDFNFDLEATDATGAKARRTFHLHVSVIRIIGSTPNATAGTAVSLAFLGVGGTGPYTFSYTPASTTQDALPPGVNISTAGLLSGTPQSSGSYRFILRLDDSAGHFYRRTFTWTVASASGLVVNSTNPPDLSLGMGRLFQVLDASPAAGGFGIYDWTVVGGSLPPGLQLTKVNSYMGDPRTMLAGRPLSVGTSMFTLRATNVANNADFADHVFTVHVSPMQVVTPRGIVSPDDLGDTRAIAASAPGQVGTPLTMKVPIAGGVGPYTFAPQDATLMPANLSLSANGNLSGTPQQAGSFVIPITITDSASGAANVLTTNIQVAVTEAGKPQPLLQTGRSTPGVASAGVPIGIALDSAALRYGTPPFNWSLVQGTLPPGLSIIPGLNGIENYIGGTPTVPGEFEALFNVTDAAGQSQPQGIGIEVSPIALRPNGNSGDFISGLKVGSSATVNLTASGGTAPYVYELTSISDQPAGMVLNANGTLTGTPTHAGYFLLTVHVTDAALREFATTFRVAVDNAAGEVSALALNPKPVQKVYEIGQTLPTVSLVVNSLASAGTVMPFSLALSGIPGVSLSQTTGTNTGTAATTIPFTIDAAGVSAGTYTGIVTGQSAAAASQGDWTSFALTVLPARPCDATELSSYSTIATAPAKTGLNFSVTAGPGCAWNAQVSDPWISVTSGAAGNGSGKVIFSITTNSDPAQRIGTITVLGKVFSITQFGTACSTSINPGSMSSVSAAGGTVNVAVAASSSSCTWDAVGLNATPASGSGSAVVKLTIPPNLSPGQRPLSATIATKPFNVTQLGAACVTTLSAPSAFSAAAGDTGTVDVTVTPGCSYDTISTANWLTAQTNASGATSQTLSYATQPNTTTSPRTATLVIGGQAFQVNQAGLACSVTIDTSGLPSAFSSGGGSALIAVNANASTCGWQAISDSPWLSVVPPGSTGTGSVLVSAAANGATTQRSGSVTIAGQTVSLSQYGIACSYTLQSASGSVPPAGGNGEVGVGAPQACSWGATSNVSWITVTSFGGAGTAPVAFVAQPNPAAVERTGSLTIAGLTYSITESPAVCSYSLSTSGTTVAAGGATDAFTFTSSVTSCATTVKSYSNWIQATPTLNGVSGGLDNGSGSVSFSVEPNTSSLLRTGRIQVGDQLFTIAQTASACSFSLNSYGVLYSKLGGSDLLLGSRSALGCAPAVGTDEPGIVHLGALGGPAGNIFSLPYSVDLFSPEPISPTTRRMHVTFGGQVLTIKQNSW